MNHSAGVDQDHDGSNIESPNLTRLPGAIMTFVLGNTSMKRGTSLITAPLSTCGITMFYILCTSRLGPSVEAC